MAKQLEDAVCGTNKIILKLIDNHKTNYINYWKTYDSNSTSHNIDLDSDQSLKSCVATNLEPGTYYTFQFIDKKKYVLQSRRLRTINLPSIVKLFSDEETMQKDFDEMKKTFSKYQFSEKEVKLGVKSHNILLLGERQSGKSNLLNSLRGIFEGSFQGGISFGGIDESNTLTTFLRKYKFRFTEKIRMFDLFGYYEGSKGFNYSNEFFEELINGNLKDYTTETEWKMVPQENNKDKKRQNDISEEVHSVILVVDACELDQQIINRHQKMQQDVTTLLNTLNQREIPITLVLTKIDLYLKKFVAKNSKNFNDKDLSCLRYNSKELFNNPEVIRLMREAKNLYQVDSIFPFVNYTVPTLKNGKEARNLHVDYLGLAILRDSTKKAQENILNSQTLLRLRHKSDAYHHFNDNENINDEDLQEEEDTKNLKKDYEILVRIPTINESTTIQESVDLFESQIEIGSGSKLVKQGKSELYTSMNYSDKDFIPYIEDEFTPEMIAKLGDKEFNLLIYKNSMDEPIGVVPNVKEKTTLKLLKEKIETYVVCPNNFYFAKKQAWKTTPDGSKEMIKTGLDKLMVKDIFHSEGNWERERDGYNVVIYFDDPKIEFKIITELNQKAIDAGKYAKLVNDDKNFGAILKKSQSLKEIQDIVSQALGNDYSLVKCKKFKENIKPIIFTLDELTSTTLEKFKKSDTWYKDEKTKGDIILIYPKAKGN